MITRAEPHKTSLCRCLKFYTVPSGIYRLLRARALQFLPKAGNSSPLRQFWITEERNFQPQRYEKLRTHKDMCGLRLPPSCKWDLRKDMFCGRIEFSQLVYSDSELNIKLLIICICGRTPSWRGSFHRKTRTDAEKKAQLYPCKVRVDLSPMTALLRTKWSAPCRCSNFSDNCA